MSSPTSAQTITESEQAWAALEYPFSVREVDRLICLKHRVAAAWHIDAHEHESQDTLWTHASQLAFQRWRYVHGRMGEGALA